MVTSVIVEMAQCPRMVVVDGLAGVVVVGRMIVVSVAMISIGIPGVMM